MKNLFFLFSILVFSCNIPTEDSKVTLNVTSTNFTNGYTEINYQIVNDNFRIMNVKINITVTNTNNEKISQELINTVNGYSSIKNKIYILTYYNYSDVKASILDVEKWVP